MEHVVFYPSADGSPAFRRVASLDDAVQFVEHLRNVEEVSDFSVHALTEVPLSMRAYYKVDMSRDDGYAVRSSALGETGVAAPAEAVPAAPAARAAVPVAQAEPAPVAAAPVPDLDPAAAANGRKSLGFFAR